MAVLHTDGASFNKVINQDKPVLVDFWAPWCGPCKMLGPVLEEAEKEIGDKAIIAKVNVDDEQDLAVRIGISYSHHGFVQERRSCRTFSGFYRQRKDC